MTSSICRVVRVIRCRWPAGRGGAPGQGHVDPVARQPLLQLAGVELGRAPLEQRFERLAGPVGAAADRPALPRRAARRCRAGSSSARPCGRGSGPAAPRARRCPGRPRSPPPPRPRSLRSAQAHSAVSRMAGDDIRCAGDRSRGGDVERLGGRRAAAGSSPAASQLGQHLRRQALALGAEAERRGAVQRVEPRAAVGDQRDPRRAASPRPGRAAAAGRRSSPCSPAPPSGRSGSAQSGPSTTVPPSRACGGADDRADVAGVADAVQVDAGRRRLLRPATAARPRSPECPSRAPRPRPAAPARPPRRRGRCRRRSAGSAARRPPPARPRAGPRPRSRTAPRARGACARAACGPASASRFGGWRSSRVGFGSGFFFSWNVKSGP